MVQELHGKAVGAGPEFANCAEAADVHAQHKNEDGHEEKGGP